MPSCCNRIIQKPKAYHRLPLADLSARRNACRKCKFCTKCDDQKFARFQGLCHTSKCRKVNLAISLITIDSSFACPIGKFKALTK